jgi:hypothetical protein
VLGAQDLNPSGFWEPIEAVEMNLEFVNKKEIINNFGLWNEDIETLRNDEQEYIERICSFLGRFPTGATLLVKEFRINELLPFWLEAARRERLEPKVVIAVRHPQEVFESTNAAILRTQESAGRRTQKLAIEAFNAMWLKTNLSAERASRHLPRAFVNYSSLMQDWRCEITRIKAALDLELRPQSAAIDAFLNSSLYRKRAGGPIAETFGYSWMTRVYAGLYSAGCDASLDIASFDEIYHAYCLIGRALHLSSSSFTKETYLQLLRDHLERVPVWEAGRDF